MTKAPIVSTSSAESTGSDREPRLHESDLNLPSVHQQALRDPQLGWLPGAGQRGAQIPAPVRCLSGREQPVAEAGGLDAKRWVHTAWIYGKTTVAATRRAVHILQRSSSEGGGRQAEPRSLRCKQVLPPASLRPNPQAGKHGWPGPTPPAGDQCTPTIRHIPASACPGPRPHMLQASSQVKDCAPALSRAQVQPPPRPAVPKIAMPEVPYWPQALTLAASQ
jgi:hypothetical protein